MPLHGADDPALRVENIGPLQDRIDIHIEVPAAKYKELRATSSSEDSAAVRGRVIAARDRQAERFKGEKKTYCNAPMASRLTRKCLRDYPRRRKAARGRGNATRAVSASA